MTTKRNKHLYLFSAILIFTVSLYPLVLAGQMLYLAVTNGYIELEQNRAIAVPFAAVCFTLLAYALAEPLIYKLKQLKIPAYPAGLAICAMIYITIELVMENITIRVNEAALTFNHSGFIPAVNYTAWERYAGIVDGTAAKAAYYCLSAVIIIAVTSVIYSIAVMHRTSNYRQKTPILMRGLISAGLLAISVIFIYQTEPNKALLRSGRTVNDIKGCYVAGENIYSRPDLSLAFSIEDAVFGFDDDIFIRAVKGHAGVSSYNIDYCNMPVEIEDFDLPLQIEYSEAYLLAVAHIENTPVYALYEADSNFWVVLCDAYMGIVRIYILEKTELTTLENLYTAIQYYERNSPVPMPDGDEEDREYENQMTLRDVYALARLGEELMPEDFDPYCYWPAGDDFTQRHYLVAGGGMVMVDISGDTVETAELLSRNSIIAAATQSIDLREGINAVAGYLDPFNNFMQITFAQRSSIPDVPGLLFEEVISGSLYRYYLSIGEVDELYVTPGGSGTVTAADALTDGMVTIETLVAAGVRGISMVPADNPHGGRFTHISGMQTFKLGEDDFYPSKTFIYAIFDEQTDGDNTIQNIEQYFDIEEIFLFMHLYGYERGFIDELREAITEEELELISIGQKKYADTDTLAELGIRTAFLWPGSAYSPVWFSFVDSTYSS